MNIFKQKLIQKLDALSLNISALGSSACASINKFQVLKFSIPFLKVLISLLLFSYFIEITINLVNYFDLIDLSKDSIFNVNGNSGDGGDKVIVDISADVPRAWPSGVPQNFALFSTVYATYSALAKLSALSPMQRMVAAMSSAGVSLTVMSYFAAVVAVPQARLSIVSASNTNTDSVPSTAVRQADTGVDMESSSSSDISSGNNFIPEDSSLNDFILNKFFKLFEMVMDYLKPVDVSGHLDDLIGQRIFIEFILLVMCVFVTLLFTIFIINIIYFLNKDKIIKLFNNKYINMLIKYQNFVIKFNLIYIPIFIGIGLFTILNGLIWLITHPIPYTSLDIDLHQFISSKNLLLFLSMTPSPALAGQVQHGYQSLKTKHINNNYIRLACNTSQRQG
jgi:hypothetical protein